MQLSSNGLQLIKSFEGFRSNPYLDSANIPTIGYGTIVYDDGTRVTMNDSAISELDAEQCLMYQVDQKTSSLNQMITSALNQNQFDALVSFAYNLGTNALHGSTLLQYVNQSRWNEAASQFPRWDRAGGVVIAGLLRRRLAEQQLFLTPC